MARVREHLVEVTDAEAADVDRDAETSGSDRDTRADPGQPSGGSGATIIRFPDAW